MQGNKHDMIDRNALYKYKTTSDTKFNGLALDVHYQNGRIYFHDTNRGHGFEGQLGKPTETGGFTFISEDYEPGEWVFELMTIEEYRRGGEVHIEGYEIIAETVKTTQKLHKWYRKEFLGELG